MPVACLVMARRRRKRTVSLAALAAVALAFILARFGGELRDVLRPAPELPAGWFEVVRVIDGDTITVVPNPTPGARRGDDIRLIGVDTPETKDPRRPVECYGPEATAFVRTLVEGRKVRLAFGPERVDNRGRTLAYVYLEDGSLLNQELIRFGFAEATREFRHPLREEFIVLEHEARRQDYGLWKLCR
jgi:micrococcal nuclease